MKKIAAAKFKEQCLAILDRLGPEGVVVTKHGRPVARVLPVRESSAELIGALRDQVTIKGDLLSTGVSWEADG
ncbi:MAG: type II toxin-antitoxin system Phd/YefM family antitoxin [Gemmatimonadaceae bacterium]